MSDLPPSSQPPVPPGGSLPGGSPLPVPYNSPDTLTIADTEHLKILSICFYVLACLQALGGCAGLIWILMGTFFAVAGASTGDQGGAAGGAAAGGFFVCMGIAVLLVIGTISFLSFKVGQSLVKRKNRTLCFVIACLICLSFPLGTALGVFTLIVLSRPSVKASFT